MEKGTEKLIVMKKKSIIITCTDIGINASDNRGKRHL